jgi:hypothetical protein
MMVAGAVQRVGTTPWSGSAVGFGTMADSEDAHGGGLVQRTNIRPGFIEPLNPVRPHLLIERKIFRFKTELGQHLFHRNALAGALFEPGLTLTEATAVFLGDGLVIHGRVAQSGSHGVDDGFEQSDES